MREESESVEGCRIGGREEGKESGNVDGGRTECKWLSKVREKGAK